MAFREARERAGLTVKEVAEKLSITQPAVYQWEAGVHFPTAKRLITLAQLYGCSVGELLEGAEHEP